MKAILLQFPKPPCKEKWDAMYDNDLGKFCPVCQTDIFDFSDLTDDELVEILKNAPQKICGKFRASQIGRPIFIKDDKVVSKNPRFKRMLAATVLLAVSTPFLVAQDTIPIKPAPATYVSPKIESDSSLLTTLNLMDKKFKIQGNVKAQGDDSPLIGCVVSIEGTKIGVVSDMDGNYSLTVPQPYASRDSIMIRFDYVGYESQKIQYILAKKEKMKAKFSKIEMIERLELIGEIMVVPYSNDYYDPIYER